MLFVPAHTSVNERWAKYTSRNVGVSERETTRRDVHRARVSCCEPACFTPYLSQPSILYAFRPVRCLCVSLFIHFLLFPCGTMCYVWTTKNRCKNILNLVEHIKKISRAYFHYIQWGKESDEKKPRITKKYIYVGGTLKRRTQNIPQSMA